MVIMKKQLFDLLIKSAEMISDKNKTKISVIDISNNRLYYKDNNLKDKEFDFSTTIKLRGLINVIDFDIHYILESYKISNSIVILKDSKFSYGSVKEIYKDIEELKEWPNQSYIVIEVEMLPWPG